MTATWEIVVLGVGGVALTIPFQRAGQADREMTGAVSRAYAGNQYSSIAQEFMVIPLVSAPITSTVYAQVKALFAKGAQVACQAGSAGNVFEGVTSIITCSGKVTGEMIPGLVGTDNRPMWTLNLTLTEVGSGITSTAPEVNFLLTSVTSPDLAGALVSTPAGSYAGDAGTGASMFAGGTPPTASCPTVPGTIYSGAAEKKWLSVPLQSGYAVGIPRIRVEATGGSATVWQHQSTLAKLYLRRGAGAGVNIAGPWTSGYVGSLGALGYSVQYFEFTDRLNLLLQAGDRFYIELWSRLALNCGQTDDASRQFIYYGAVPGPRQNPVLILSGDIVAL